jgi:hypothetical protein
MTAEEIRDTQATIADFEEKAAHWEGEALLNPEVASVCLDYAKHLRTIAECLRLDLLEQDLPSPPN